MIGSNWQGCGCTEECPGCRTDRKSHKEARQSVSTLSATQGYIREIAELRAALAQSRVDVDYWKGRWRDLRKSFPGHERYVKN